MTRSFFGVGIAYYYHFHAEGFRRVVHPRRHALIAAGVLLLVLTRAWPGSFWHQNTFVFTYRYLGCAALIVGVLMCEIPANIVTRPLAFLGTYSYSIYLWHMALKYWRPQGTSWERGAAIYLAGAFVIGVAMSVLIELPTMRLRDWLFPGSQGNRGLAHNGDEQIAGIFRSPEIAPQDAKAA